MTEYDANGFKFVTIRGSGRTYGKSEQSLVLKPKHVSSFLVYLQVPKSRPGPAFTMFEHFIKDEPF